MKLLILGGDGYLGWPTAMYLSEQGHDVHVVDNYIRKTMAQKCQSDPLFETKSLGQKCKIFEEHTGKNIKYHEFDCCHYEKLSELISEFQPDSVIHYAEQPSAPYSMLGYEEAKYTLSNNVTTTLNVLWAIKEFAPNCHIVKLGTMGEYGTPNIDIEEGWLNINHNGRSDKFLYPRQGSSLYHTTKVLDTDLIWFYVRTHGLRVTDLMQGPVYGLSTKQTELDHRLRPHFHYDDIFGTVINRFLVQAVAGIPLTIYGQGGQKRGYLNINDTLKCIELAVANPPEPGTLDIFNQMTEVFSVNEIAAKIKAVGDNIGLGVNVSNIKNPRQEKEEHYYNPKYTGLVDLGLKPTLLTDELIEDLLTTVLQYKNQINHEMVMPRVKWK